MDIVDFDELIYNGLKTHSTYKETFNSLTDEQKDKYFIFLYWTSDVKEYLKNKDDEFILNYIKYYSHFLEKTTTFAIEKILLSLKNKKSLLTVIEYLPKRIISSYNFKLFLKSLDSDEDRMEFLDTLLSKNIKIDYTYLIAVLEDKNKIKYFKYLSNYSQISLIKKMTDLELKKEYVLKPEYSGFRSELVASVEDEDFIIEMFDKINVNKFKYNLIYKVEDKELKDKLLKRLGHKSLNKFIESFENEDDEMVKIDNDVDPKITIGVELETCHKDIEVLKILKELPYGFKIHKDGSVRSGFEVVSPILHYTTEDMSNLYHICNILKENEFYTDSSCGGHIHIGADYLETIDEYKMLLHLYCNFEDIIYLICNRANSKERPSINRYASKTRKQYRKAVNNGVFQEEYEDVYDFQQKLIGLNNSRYKGLNVYNLKKYGKQTIEFRMANGEIDFEELRHNIKLYSRLMQVAKELANSQDKEKTDILNQLSQPMKDIDRLNILLTLLFTDEKDKEFYKNRYKNNLRTLRDIVKSMISKVEYTQIVESRVSALKK